MPYSKPRWEERYLRSARPISWSAMEFGCKHCTSRSYDASEQVSASTTCPRKYTSKEYATHIDINIIHLGDAAENKEPLAEIRELPRVANALKHRCWFNRPYWWRGSLFYNLTKRALPCGDHGDG